MGGLDTTEISLDGRKDFCGRLNESNAVSDFLDGKGKNELSGDLIPGGPYVFKVLEFKNSRCVKYIIAIVSYPKIGSVPFFMEVTESLEDPDLIAYFEARASDEEPPSSDESV